MRRSTPIVLLDVGKRGQPSLSENLVRAKPSLSANLVRAKSSLSAN